MAAEAVATAKPSPGGTVEGGVTSPSTFSNTHKVAVQMIRDNEAHRAAQDITYHSAQVLEELDRAQAAPSPAARSIHEYLSTLHLREAARLAHGLRRGAFTPFHLREQARQNRVRMLRFDEHGHVGMKLLDLGG